MKSLFSNINEYDEGSRVRLMELIILVSDSCNDESKASIVDLSISPATNKPIDTIAALNSLTFERYLNLITHVNCVLDDHQQGKQMNICQLIHYYITENKIKMLEYIADAVQKSNNLFAQCQLNAYDQLFDDLVELLVHENLQLRCVSARLICAVRGYSPEVQDILEKSAAKIFNVNESPPQSSAAGITISQNIGDYDDIFYPPLPATQIVDEVDNSSVLTNLQLRGHDFALWEKNLRKIADKYDEKHVRSKIHDLTLQEDGKLISTQCSAMQSTKMILTKTTKHNILQVQAAVSKNIPLMLEGATGVGKSATIAEAAKMMNKKLIRFNMSSHINIDDLLGKISLDGNGNIKYQPQPFAEAWEHGYWILLDECNLASAAVLQSLELALETGVLIITDQSSAEQGSSRVIHRHPEFRLFATQNPNTGMFRGCRQPLSQSFVTRFGVTIFEALPPEEWEEIVAIELEEIIQSKEEASSIAKLMVNIHMRIEHDTHGESGPHAIVTIRDLLKWTNLLKSTVSHKYDKQLLGSTCWATYGAKYHSKGRSQVSDILFEQGLKALPDAISINRQGKNLVFNNFSTIPLTVLSRWSGYDVYTREQKCCDVLSIARLTPNDHSLLNASIAKLCKLHSAILDILLQPSIFLSEGLYTLHDNIVTDVVQETYAQSGDDMNEFSLLLPSVCNALYVSKFRSSAIQHKIAETINIYLGVNRAIKCKRAIMTTPLKPFIITPQVATLFYEVSLMLQVNAPILICGGEGVGKSECARVLSWLCGRQNMEYCCLTPELDPSALVGQQLPDTRSGGSSSSQVKWSSGYVTRAVENDTWILLDNLNQAEITCIERLNPILEDPPHWIITENGDCNPMSIGENFRVLGTMTMAANDKFSPAFYNRFSIVHLPTFNTKELLDFTYAFCGIRNDLSTKIQSILIYISELMQRKSNSALTTSLRAYVKMLDSVYQMTREKPELMASAAVVATQSCFVSQCKDAQTKECIEVEMRNVFGEDEIKKAACLIKLPTNGSVSSNTHVLTSTRLMYAQTIFGYMHCGLPILLEGPAACGKTSLVTYISQLMGYKVERVNNSAATTIQDYVGSYLPSSGGGFSFKEGPLLRAIKHGYIFLSDEFNLANPSVLTALFPLLEGQRIFSVPESNMVVTVHQNFHFIATQNDAQYDGRNTLPLSLRARFLDIQIGDFTENEIAQVIACRLATELAVIKDVAPKKLASLYEKLKKSSSRITLREIIKISRRFQSSAVTQHERSANELLAANCWGLLGGRTMYGFASMQTEHIKQDPTFNLLNAVGLPVQGNPNFAITFRGENTALFHDNGLTVAIPVTRAGQAFWKSHAKSDRGSLSTLTCALVKLAHALYNAEPVLLVGPTCYKTFLLHVWSKMMGWDMEEECVIAYMSAETETSDLVGQITPCSTMQATATILETWDVICRRLNKLGVNDTDNLRKEYSRLQKLRNDYLQADKQRVSRKTQHLVSMQHQEYETNSRVQELCEKIASLSSPSPSGEENNGNEDNDDMYSDENYMLDVESIATESSDFVDLLDDKDESDHSSSFVDLLANAEESNAAPDSSVNIDQQNDIVDIDDLPISLRDSSSETSSDDLLEMYKSDEPSIEESALARTMLRIETNVSAQKTSIENTVIPELTAFLNHSNEMIHMVQNMLHVLCTDDIKDAALRSLLYRCAQISEALTQSTDATQFLFRDGPLTRACKLGSTLILEDFDLPNQSVTERINSLLETEPSFNIAEDVASKENTDIAVMSSMRIIATVHRKNPQQKINLSPATRSRFTEIHLDQYTNSEVEAIVCHALNMHLYVEERPYSERITKVLCALAGASECQSSGTSPSLSAFLRGLMACVNFLSSNANRNIVIFPDRTLTAARFFLLDAMDDESRVSLVSAEIAKLGLDGNKKYDILRQPSINHGTCVLDNRPESAGYQLQNVSLHESIFSEETTSKLQLRYGNIAASRQVSPEDMFNCSLNVVPTTTMVIQLARIFAAISANAPLLISGPPGTAKSQITKTVSRLLNRPLIRINMSASTTSEQLFGSYTIRQHGGERVFEWQDGPLTSAIRQGENFVLIDEINLASPDVLDALAPLLSLQCQENGAYFLSSKLDYVPIRNTKFFATMNPVSVGGGRSRLPRSIQNIFTTVNIEAYNDIELRTIAHGVFSNLIKQDTDDSGIEMRNIGIMSGEDVNKIFDFHRSLEKAIEQRIIGKIGGPYDFNLRELIKLRDIIQGNAADLKHIHCDSMGSDEACLFIIRQCAELVYARAFPTSDDWKYVKQLLDEHLPVRKQALSHSGIDQSTKGIVKINNVYIEEGDTATRTTQGLVHTSQTMHLLELLAVAVHSNRGILLEGPTCSRKTSIVCELARLAKRNLIVLPMHQETDVGDIVGQWLPVTAAQSSQLLSLFDKLLQFFHDIEEVLLLHGYPKSVGNKFDARKILQLLRNIREAKAEAKDIMKHQSFASMLEGFLRRLGAVIACVEEAIDSVSDDDGTMSEMLQAINAMLTNTLEKLYIENEKMKNPTQENNGITFEFKMSNLVEAMQAGDWVLLDNVDSCPDSILERINSVFEESPELIVYESGELVRVKIKPGFRLFLTSNCTRVQGVKLSSALLNRVIRFWLSPIDDDCDDITASSVKATEAFSILSAMLAGINGGDEIATLFVMTHSGIRNAHAKGDVTFTGDFKITFRMLLQAVCAAKSMIQQGNEISQAMFSALLSVYTSGLQSRQVPCVISIIVSALVELRFKGQHTFLTRAPLKQDTTTTASTATEEIIQETQLLQGKIVLLSMKQFVHALENCANPEADSRRFCDQWNQFVNLYLKPMLLTCANEGSQECLKKAVRVQSLVESASLSKNFLEATDKLKSIRHHLDAIMAAKYDLSSSTLYQLLIRSIKDTSLDNFESRFAVVHRTIKVVVMLRRLVSYAIFFDEYAATETKLAQQHLGALQELSVFARHYFQILSHDSLQSVFARLNGHMRDLNTRGLKHELLRSLFKPPLISLLEHKPMQQLFAKLSSHGIDDSIIRCLENNIKFITMAWRVGVEVLIYQSKTSSNVVPQCETSMEERIKDLETCVAAYDVHQKLSKVVGDIGQTEASSKSTLEMLRKLHSRCTSATNKHQNDWSSQSDLHALINACLQDVQSDIDQISSSENYKLLRDHKFTAIDNAFICCIDAFKSHLQETDAIYALSSSLWGCDRSVCESPAFATLLALGTSQILKGILAQYERYSWDKAIPLAHHVETHRNNDNATILLFEERVYCAAVIMTKQQQIKIIICGSNEFINKFERWVDDHKKNNLYDDIELLSKPVNDVVESSDQSIRIAAEISVWIESSLTTHKEQHRTASLLNDRATLLETLIQTLRKSVCWKDDTHIDKAVRLVIAFFEQVESFVESAKSTPTFEEITVQHQFDVIKRYSSQSQIKETSEYAIHTQLHQYFKMTSVESREAYMHLMMKMPELCEKYPQATAQLDFQLKINKISPKDRRQVVKSLKIKALQQSSQILTQIVLEHSDFFCRAVTHGKLNSVPVEKLSRSILHHIEQVSKEDSAHHCISLSAIAAEWGPLMEWLASSLQIDVSRYVTVFDRALRVQEENEVTYAPTPLCEPEDAVRVASEEHYKQHIRDLEFAGNELDEALNFLNGIRPRKVALIQRIVQLKLNIERQIHDAKQSNVHMLNKRRALADVKEISAEAKALRIVVETEESINNIYDFVQIPKVSSTMFAKDVNTDGIQSHRLDDLSLELDLTKNMISKKQNITRYDDALLSNNTIDGVWKRIAACRNNYSGSNASVSLSNLISMMSQLSPKLCIEAERHNSSATKSTQDMFNQLAVVLQDDFAEYRLSVLKHICTDIMDDQIGKSSAVYFATQLLSVKEETENFIHISSSLHQMMQYCNILKKELQSFGDDETHDVLISCDMLPPTLHISDIAILFMNCSSAALDILSKQSILNQALSCSYEESLRLVTEARKISILREDKVPSSTDKNMLTVWSNLLSNDRKTLIQQQSADYCAYYFNATEKRVLRRRESLHQNFEPSDSVDVENTMADMMGNIDIHPPAQRTIAVAIINMTHSILQSVRQEQQQRNSIEEKEDERLQFEISQALSGYSSNNLPSKEQLQQRKSTRKLRLNILDNLLNLSDISGVFRGAAPPENYPAAVNQSITFYDMNPSLNALQNNWKANIDVVSKIRNILSSNLAEDWIREAATFTIDLLLASFHVLARAQNECLVAIDLCTSANAPAVIQTCRSVCKIVQRIRENSDAVLLDALKSKNSTAVANAITLALADHEHLEQLYQDSKALGIHGLSQCLQVASNFTARLIICAKNRIALENSRQSIEMTRVGQTLKKSTSSKIHKFLSKLYIGNDSNDSIIEFINEVTMEAYPTLSSMQRCFFEALRGVTANPFGAMHLITDRQALLRSYYAKPSAALNYYMTHLCELINHLQDSKTMRQIEVDAAIIHLAQTRNMARLQVGVADTAELSKSFIHHVRNEMDKTIDTATSFFEKFENGRAQGKTLRWPFETAIAEVRVVFLETCVKSMVEIFWEQHELSILSEKFPDYIHESKLDLWLDQDTPNADIVRYRDIYAQNDVISVYKEANDRGDIGCIVAMMRTQEALNTLVRSSVEQGATTAIQYIQIFAALSSFRSDTVISTLDNALISTAVHFSTPITKAETAEELLERLLYPWRKYSFDIIKNGAVELITATENVSQIVHNANVAKELADAQQSIRVNLNTLKEARRRARVTQIQSDKENAEKIYKKYENDYAESLKRYEREMQSFHSRVLKVADEIQEYWQKLLTQDMTNSTVAIQINSYEIMRSFSENTITQFIEWGIDPSRCNVINTLMRDKFMEASAVGFQWILRIQQKGVLYNVDIFADNRLVCIISDGARKEVEILIQGDVRTLVLRPRSLFVSMDSHPITCGQNAQLEFGKGMATASVRITWIRCHGYIKTACDGEGEVIYIRSTAAQMHQRALNARIKLEEMIKNLKQQKPRLEKSYEPPLPKTIIARSTRRYDEDNKKDDESHHPFERTLDQFATQNQSIVKMQRSLIKRLQVHIDSAQNLSGRLQPLPDIVDTECVEEYRKSCPSIDTFIIPQLRVIYDNSAAFTTDIKDICTPAMKETITRYALHTLPRIALDAQGALDTVLHHAFHWNYLAHVLFSFGASIPKEKNAIARQDWKQRENDYNISRMIKTYEELVEARNNIRKKERDLINRTKVVIERIFSPLACENMAAFATVLGNAGSSSLTITGGVDALLCVSASDLCIYMGCHSLSTQRSSCRYEYHTLLLVNDTSEAISALLSTTSVICPEAMHNPIAHPVENGSAIYIAAHGSTTIALRLDKLQPQGGEITATFKLLLADNLWSIIAVSAELVVPAVTISEITDFGTLLLCPHQVVERGLTMRNDTNAVITVKSEVSSTHSRNVFSVEPAQVSLNPYQKVIMNLRMVHPESVGNINSTISFGLNSPDVIVQSRVAAHFCRAQSHLFCSRNEREYTSGATIDIGPCSVHNKKVSTLWLCNTSPIKIGVKISVTGDFQLESSRSFNTNRDERSKIDISITPKQMRKARGELCVHYENGEVDIYTLIAECGVVSLKHGVICQNGIENTIQFSINPSDPDEFHILSGRKVPKARECEVRLHNIGTIDCILHLQDEMFTMEPPTANIPKTGSATIRLVRKIKNLLECKGEIVFSINDSDKYTIKCSIKVQRPEYKLSINGCILFSTTSELEKQQKHVSVELKGSGPVLNMFCTSSETVHLIDTSQTEEDAPLIKKTVSRKAPAKYRLAFHNDVLLQGTPKKLGNVTFEMQGCDIVPDTKTMERIEVFYVPYGTKLYEHVKNVRNNVPLHVLPWMKANYCATKSRLPATTIISDHFNTQVLAEIVTMATFSTMSSIHEDAKSIINTIRNEKYDDAAIETCTRFRRTFRYYIETVTPRSRAPPPELVRIVTLFDAMEQLQDDSILSIQLVGGFLREYASSNLERLVILAATDAIVQFIDQCKAGTTLIHMIESTQSSHQYRISSQSINRFLKYLNQEEEEIAEATRAIAQQDNKSIITLVMTVISFSDNDARSTMENEIIAKAFLPQYPTFVPLPSLLNTAANTNRSSKCIERTKSFIHTVQLADNESKSKERMICLLDAVQIFVFERDTYAKLRRMLDILLPDMLAWRICDEMQVLTRASFLRLLELLSAEVCPVAKAKLFGATNKWVIRGTKTLREYLAEAIENLKHDEEAQQESSYIIFRNYLDSMIKLAVHKSSKLKDIIGLIAPFAREEDLDCINAVFVAWDKYFNMPSRETWSTALCNTAIWSGWQRLAVEVAVQLSNEGINSMSLLRMYHPMTAEVAGECIAELKGTMGVATVSPWQKLLIAFNWMVKSLSRFDEHHLPHSLDLEIKRVSGFIKFCDPTKSFSIANATCDEINSIVEMWQESNVDSRKDEELQCELIGEIAKSLYSLQKAIDYDKSWGKIAALQRLLTQLLVLFQDLYGSASQKLAAKIVEEQELSNDNNEPPEIPLEVTPKIPNIDKELKDTQQLSGEASLPISGQDDCESEEEKQILNLPHKLREAQSSLTEDWTTFREQLSAFRDDTKKKKSNKWLELMTRMQKLTDIANTWIHVSAIYAESTRLLDGNSILHKDFDSCACTLVDIGICIYQLSTLFDRVMRFVFPNASIDELKSKLENVILPIIEQLSQLPFNELRGEQYASLRKDGELLTSAVRHRKTFEMPGERMAKPQAKSKRAPNNLHFHLNNKGKKEDRNGSNLEPSVIYDKEEDFDDILSNRLQKPSSLAAILGFHANNNDARIRPGHGSIIGRKLHSRHRHNSYPVGASPISKKVRPQSNPVAHDDNMEVSFFDGMGESDDEFDEINMNIAMSHQLSDHELQNTDITKLYEQSTSKHIHHGQTVVIDLDPSSLTTDTDSELFTYHRLVKSEIIANMIYLVVSNFRRIYTEVLGESSHTQKFQILLMIDNSTSMRLKKVHVLKSVVVLLEVLRQLEFEVAVGRFGRRTSQVVCKGFNDPLTVTIGEAILQSLTFDEGTYPASALTNLTNKVWSRDTQDSNVHRIAIMLTDGLTQERVVKDWQTPLQQLGIELGVLLLGNGTESDRSPNFLKFVTESFKELGPQEAHQLPLRLADLVESTFSRVVARIRSKGSNMTAQHICNLVTTSQPDFSKELHSLIGNIRGDAGMLDNLPEARVSKAALYKVGRYHKEANTAHTSLASIEDGVDEGMLHRALDSTLATYKFLQESDPTKTLESERLWAELQSRITGLAEDITAALEDGGLPVNKFSRRRAELRGGSLYLPAVIRAIITNYQYKKIFGARLAGGKRVYSICLALDVSSSMEGVVFENALASVAAFIAALSRMGIDNFSFIIFGEDVRIIKTEEQLMDRATIHMLLTNLVHGRSASRDADAIQVAMSLVSKIQGPKKIFVFTDGYTSSGKRLESVLHLAQQEGIEVVGIAVGLDRFRVREAYNNFIECAIPLGVPKALQAFYASDSISNRYDGETDLDRFIRTEIEQRTREDPEAWTSIEDIMRNRPHVFNDLLDRIQSEANVQMQTTGSASLEVSIGILIDITGSTQPFLPEVTRQLRYMTSKIREGIEKECMGLELKLLFRVLGYRDHDCEQCYVAMNAFTDNIDEVNRFIESLRAFGGADEPEEVMGALHMASQWKDWQGNAKVLVLIADAPGHGMSNDPAKDTYPQGHPSVPHPKNVMKALVDQSIDLFFCRINGQKTLRMEDILRKYYDDKQQYREIIGIDMFDRKSITECRFHVIFVLDESGSMSGSRWESLKKALHAFINRRLSDQATNEIVSIITFDKTTRNRLQYGDHTAALHWNEEPHGGRTNFTAGLEAADRLLQLHSSNHGTPVIIFMSDGEDQANPEATIGSVHSIMRNHGNKGITVHTVGFADGATGRAATILKNMAQHGNGKFQAAVTEEDLLRAFVKCAAGSLVLDSLVNQLANKVGSMVSKKIMADYL